MGGGSGEGPAKVCPRCGLPYSYIEYREVHGRTYAYAVHYEYEGGKRRKRRCYLGPVGSYEYVTKTHGREGLILRGLLDDNRVIEYLDALISYLSRPDVRLTRDLALRFADRLERMARRLREYAKEKEEGE